MLRKVRWGALPATTIAVVLYTTSCGSFGADDTAPSTPTSSNDAGAAGVVPRDVRVEIDWPRVRELDPSADPRASKGHVTLIDASDGARRIERVFSKTERGPFDFPAFTTSPKVDVVVELTGADGRLLGYGEARRWDLGRATTVSVALRRRLLYVFNADRTPEELRVLDLAPAARGEPAIEEAGAPLASVPSGKALVMTSDGRLLVESGASSTGGAIAVFETSTHERTKVIELSFVADVLVPIDDGRRVLALPGEKTQTTQLARVDLESGSVEDLPSGFQGGSLVVQSAARSPDAARIVAAATYRASPNGPGKGYLLVHETSTGTTTTVEVPDVEIASAVRFTPDGARLIASGYVHPPGDDVSTGTIFIYDPSPTTPKKKIVMAANASRPIALAVHPNGKRAYVTTDTLYPGGNGCCGELHVLDLGTDTLVTSFPMTASGPEYALASAIRLPYAPFRVLAGQSDPGNNVHAPIVELLSDADRPGDIDVSAPGSFGTLRAMASPFAEPL